MKRQTFFAAGAGLALSALLAACGNSSPPVGSGASGFTDAAQAGCVMRSPYRQVGADLDAPGRLESPLPSVGSAPGACKDSREYRFGSGLYDITGVVANTGGMGWEDPTQVLSGLHMRQYARAFALESPCNGKRIIFVSTDTGMIFGSVRQGVLAAIASDPALSAFYGPDNVMLSATHTHSGPAGFSHHEAFNLLHFGFDADTFNVIVRGITESIKRAHANLQAHPQTGSIRLAVGELLNTNLNRSKPAFILNTEAERREFVNARGEEVQVDKRFVQLNLVRSNGSAVGVINWFGVHPTTIGPKNHLVSSDNKGFASQGFERIMRTDYRAPSTVDSFVAAFAQTDEGDSSPNIFIEEFPHPDPARGGGRDDFESNAIAGTKQLAKALELYAEGSALRGPVDYRLFNVQMDAVTVNDPVVLASLRHPAPLDAPVKRTCIGALGPSFAAGAEDGPGPAQEGVSCQSSPDVVAAATADLQTLINLNPATAPAGALPVSLISAVAACQTDRVPVLDLACHAEKPATLVVGPPLSAEPNIVPFQLIRLGNLAILGVSWEVTTMSARRLRKMLLDILAPVGVDTVIVAGLVNDFSHYLTTREEYSSQQYEGASNIYGPWTLAAVQQEARRLAISLRDGAPAPAGPAYVDGLKLLMRPPYVASDVPGVASYGSVVADVPATAGPGDVVRAEFQAGHPRNDLKTQASYAYVEKQRPDGSWEVMAEDRDPELVYIWKPALPVVLPVDPPATGPSTAEIVWTIPRNASPGVYRLRHEGVARSSAALPVEPYSGISSPFTLEGPRENCP